MQFPVEIVEQIVLYSKSFNVAYALKDYISRRVYDEIDKNILIYGQIQSGKTKEIIKILKNREYKDEKKVLIIQNSLMVLKQYIERLNREGIEYQIITKNTKTINKNVAIVMNNKYRYNYFKKIEPKKYIVILDESDQTWRNCPLKGYKTYHVTATPYNDMQYDRIIMADVQKNYYGLDKIKVEVNDDTNEIIDEFLSTSEGMMLINTDIYIKDMKSNAAYLSKIYPKVPIILLTSEKRLYINKRIKKIKEDSISNIIDKFINYKHIIFIANRMSSRGLSYVSSDYSRHLTCQITKVRSKITTFLQSLRILGVYNNNPTLKLYINSRDEELFNKHIDFIKKYNINDLITTI